MSIESAINQEKFRNVYHKAMVNFIFTSNWHHDRHLHTFKPHGIIPQEYNVLRILRGVYPSSLRINDIVKRVLDRMSNTSRLIDGLVRKDLVERAKNNTDKRSVNIRLTKKGMALVNSLDEVIIDSENKFAVLTEDEAEQFNILLDKLRG